MVKGRSGRHLSQLGALVSEYERFGNRKGPLPTVPGAMTLRSHHDPMPHADDGLPPEDTRHGDAQLEQLMAAMDKLRLRSKKKAHKEVRVQPHRRAKVRHAATPVTVAANQLPEYDTLPRHAQVLVNQVVGSGVVTVTTASVGPPVDALLKAVDDRLGESKAPNTWKSLQCPFNQFIRFQQEKGLELISLPNHLQLLAFAESKMTDGSISKGTAHKYIRRIRQVFDMLQRPYSNVAIDAYLRALKRQGGLRPESQAPPATRTDIFNGLALCTPSERVGLMTGWKTASRTDELDPLVKESFERKVVTTPEGAEVVVWVITFPYHKGDPFGLSTVVPVVFGDWEPEIHAWWQSLPPGGKWTDMTTERMTAIMDRVRPGLSSHSIKRGALLLMLRAGVPLSVIQMIAKHKDIETLLVYLPRDEVALALGLWEASLCL